MFGAMALDEEYWAKRIDKFIALAPVTKLDWATSSLI